jgi:hypothetical protein
MLRRSAIAAILLAGVALTAAACGGGGSSSKTTTSSGGSDSDAAGILSGIKTNVADQGPQKVSLTFTAKVSGSPTDPTIGAFLSKPVTFTLTGPVDAKDKKSDVTFEIAAGPLKVDGGLRQVGDDAFVQVNGKWYALPAGSLSGTSGSSSGGTSTTSSVDPSAILKAFGDPTKLLQNAKVEGSDKVDGIDSDHVSGNVDLAALVQGLSSVAGSSGASSSPISPAQITSEVSSLQQYVQSATADLWVGKDDKQIHRFATTIDGKTDAATQKSSGIDGFTITMDVSATPTDAPSVSAPSNPAPISQLEADLGGVLGGMPTGG